MPAEFAPKGLTEFNNRMAISADGLSLIVDAFDGNDYMEFIYSYELGSWNLYKVACKDSINQSPEASFDIPTVFETYADNNGTEFVFRGSGVNYGAGESGYIDRFVSITNKDRWHYHEKGPTTDRWYPAADMDNLALDGVFLDNVVIYDKRIQSSEFEDIYFWNKPQLYINVDVQSDGVSVDRQVLLFDKLTGQFEQFIETDTTNTFNIDQSDYALKYVISFDPDQEQHPIGIDDIIPNMRQKE